MDSNFSIVLFTLLSQGSVGLLLLSIFWTGPGRKSETAQIYRQRSVLVAGILALAGLVASFAHLQYPLHSINALNNLSASWMSREILADIIYMISLAGIIFFQKIIPNRNLSSLFIILAIISSILLLISMIKIYMLPSLPWLNTIHTPVSFICSAAFIGSSALILSVIGKESSMARNLLIFAALFLAISFINWQIFIDLISLHGQLITVAMIMFILSFAALIPALISKSKNILLLSAVIFIILGILVELIHRHIMLTFTNISI